MTGLDPMWRPPADAWSRRDFMRNGFASVALLCALPGQGPLGGRGDVTSAALRAQARSPFEPFRRDLPRIPELRPVQRTRTRDVYEVTIRESMAEVLPGFETPIYGYQGIYPGPTIRARTGREVVLRQHNALPFESNVHLHGGHVPAGHDGHPMDVIPPGGSFEYHYPNEQDAASLWYHDHAHGRTSRTLYHGLLAMYVLEDDLEHELDLPSGDYDLPIVIADHAFNRDGSFRYRREHRRRLPRRHDPRQRRRLAAYARGAAQVPPPPAQRVELTLVQPAARRSVPARPPARRTSSPSRGRG